MASATGIPENIPSQESPPQPGYGEDSPLLGQRGDATQREGMPIWRNLFIGTAILAQVGIILLTLHVYLTILLSAPISLFTPHPLLNSLALLLLTQAILILQPTHTPSQKRLGAHIHGILNTIALVFFLASLAIILANKFSHNGQHFASPHAIMGLVTYLFLLVQVAIGSTMYLLPGLYGGEANAKSVWKYHRMSGYAVVVLGFGTVLAACWTPYNVGVLGVKAWAVGVCGGLVILGLAARVRVSKFGLGYR